jgi:Transglycosylase SLT domain
MLALAVVSCAGQATAGPVDGLCAALARQAERTEGIPSGLVEAVALAESGRWFADDGTTRPWPWTITAGSDSFFLSSKPEALRKVHELRSQGRSNIDVGCMQINLGYHGDAFASVADALEPAANVAYGAQFLKKLQAETQSWARATARYHSRHPQRGQAYREKVYRFWQQVQGGRVVDQVPIRLVGRPLVANDPSPLPAPARLIAPDRRGAHRQPRGTISVLRGGATTVRDG